MIKMQKLIKYLKVGKLIGHVTQIEYISNLTINCFIVF